MQVGATLADVDIPEGERTTYPWTHTYDRQWLESRTNVQVRTEIIQDMTNEAQSIADASSRIDFFKQFVGQILDLNVS